MKKGKRICDTLKVFASLLPKKTASSTNRVNVTSQVIAQAHALRVKLK